MESMKGQSAAETKKPTQSRPTGITAIGIIAILGGILGLFGALPVLMSNPGVLEFGLGSVVVIFSILGFIVGGGVLSMATHQVWTLALSVYIASVPLGIAEILLGGSTGLIGGITRTIVGVVFVYYLIRPTVKSYFAPGHTDATGSLRP